MRKETYILVAVGLLAFAGTLVWQRSSPSAPMVDTSTGMPSTERITSYEEQIENLAAFDASLILYQETAALSVERLEILRAIAVSPEDQVYAGGGNSVQVLDAEGNTIRVLKTDGIVSSLAVDAGGKLYVATENKIVLFLPGEKEGAVFGSLPDEAMITSLTTTEQFIFAADANSRTVKRFALDGTLDKVIDGKSAVSQDATGFVVPSPSFDIAPAQAGTLWIVNPGRQRLEEYDHNGVPIRTWKERSGMEIEAFCGCCNPAHIARLSNGNIVTSEKGLFRIKLYSSRGPFIGVVAPTTAFDENNAPLDLAVDSLDRILVADPARKQIRIFESRTSQ
jgi:sugar lactone lactonase YvrE